MGRRQSLRTKAAHFVSDLTTVLLNPISDKPSKPPPPPSEGVDISNVSDSESANRDGSHNLTNGPDTSSFTSFLYSFLSSSDSTDNVNSGGQNETRSCADVPPSDSTMKENSGKKSLLSRGRQTLGRAINQAARITRFRSQEPKDETEMKLDDGHGSRLSDVEMRYVKPEEEEHTSLIDLPEPSEPSALLSEKMRNILYASLPALIHGRKWMLLYSTQRHGISLLTLYRRSMLWPGLSLLVVGDRKGAVFGGLVEAPLKPSGKRYQGTSNTFVFTNTSGLPTVYRPTGVNRYFTLCCNDALAIGGGGHFALYLDGDLLNGSSSVSETYGNPCLAHTQDFEVKEVELWGFVYGSKYEEVLALSRTEAPGICRW